MIVVEKSTLSGAVFYVHYVRGGGHIVFGADPVGISIGICVSVTLSCLTKFLSNM